MNTIDFCFWLQGFFEISDAEELTTEQVQIIKNHLNLVFKHEIDPLRNSESELSPEELQDVHDGKIPPEPVGPLNTSELEHRIGT